LEQTAPNQEGIEQFKIPRNTQGEEIKELQSILEAIKEKISQNSGCCPSFLIT
jgi:hypothetical protein